MYSEKKRLSIITVMATIILSTSSLSVLAEERTFDNYDPAKSQMAFLGMSCGANGYTETNLIDNKIVKTYFPSIKFSGNIAIKENDFAGFVTEASAISEKKGYLYGYTYGITEKFTVEPDASIVRDNSFLLKRQNGQEGDWKTVELIFSENMDLKETMTLYADIKKSQFDGLFLINENIKHQIKKIIITMEGGNIYESNPEESDAFCYFDSADDNMIDSIRHVPGDLWSIFYRNWNIDENERIIPASQINNSNEQQEKVKNISDIAIPEKVVIGQ